MLMQAYETGAMIVLLDGIDEAAGQRETMEKFVHTELVQSGNRIILTSRPTGVQKQLYQQYWIVADLLPMTIQMQRKHRSLTLTPCPSQAVEMQMQDNAQFVQLLNLLDKRSTGSIGGAALQAELKKLEASTGSRRTCSDEDLVRALDFLAEALKEP
eukprot:7382270-Prymnesium_polylepis.1